MNSPFAPGVGRILSADIAVPEHEREVRFYSRVLSTGDSPLWREKDLMNNLGIPIIGLGAQGAEYGGLPIQWMPHIQVADVAASVQRALALGGRELMHAKGEDGSSQWAVLLDPSGAAFGTIPVISADSIPEDGSTGSTTAAEAVGRIAWVDLTVSDASAARDFYGQVVGWSAQEVEIRDGEDRYADYNMIGEDGTPLAGICHARGVNASLPPAWMLYLPVGDLDESLRRVTEQGGKVIQATRGADGAYAYAAVQDPVGAYVALTPA